MKITEKIILTTFGLIILLVIVFNVSKMLFCSPDRSVKDVASPLAKIIVEHIEKNDVIENLSDIKNIPYELKDCIKTRHEEETRDDIMVQDDKQCSFESYNKTYYLKVENHFNNINTYHNIYIEITQNKTKYQYEIRYNVKKGKWNYKKFINPNVYYDWDCWVCNPKLFRITD